MRPGAYSESQRIQLLVDIQVAEEESFSISFDNVGFSPVDSVHDAFHLFGALARNEEGRAR